MFTLRLLKKFFHSSYLHRFTSNLLLLPLVEYSPVTFFGKARATCGSYFPVKSLYLYSSCKLQWADSTALVCQDSAFFLIRESS